MAPSYSSIAQQLLHTIAKFVSLQEDTENIVAQDCLLPGVKQSV